MIIIFSIAYWVLGIVLGITIGKWIGLKKNRKSMNETSKRIAEIGKLLSEKDPDLKKIDELNHVLTGRLEVTGEYLGINKCSIIK